MNERPLRVMLDARMLIGRFSGVARFVTRLTDHLAQSEGVQVVALCGTDAYEPWVGRDDIQVVTSGFAKRDRTASRRLRWEGMRLRRLIKAANVDVFHATWNTGVPALCPVPVVLTIHDLIPWFHPNGHFATGVQKRCYRRAVRASARRATCVTTVSEYVRNQVISTLSVPPLRAVTIHNGVDLPQLDANPGAKPASPYVLYVGGHEHRKNVAGLFRAMRRYWTASTDPMELRITGDQPSLHAEAAAEFEKLDDKSRVRFLGAVDDAELSRQYAGARALLMLSHDEGFGLPVLEAMAHGCPVIASRSASLPEVVGEAGILVEPDDAEGVCATLRGLLESPTRHAELIAAGRDRARSFGWDAAAVTFLGLYRQAAARAAQAKRASLAPPSANLLGDGAISSRPEPQAS